MPPDWARQLLDTVSRQCAARQRDSIALFRSFDSDGDGFISHAEFQAAMLKLGGYNKEGVSAEARAKMETMLLDLAAWVDADGNGRINYLEFTEAFRLVEPEPQVRAARRPPPPPRRLPRPPVVSPSAHPVRVPSQRAEENPLSELLEQLCGVFFTHRWSLKRAFEYFDTNGDGVLSPEEFTHAVEALGSLDSSGGAKPLLDMSKQQIERLVSALDKDGDGYIDYDEFLLALEATDSHEL